MYYLDIIGRSVAIYIFIVIAVRLFGKKEIAQLSIIDLVFILLISNSVQTAMVGRDTTLIGGIISATSLFITNSIFKHLTNKFPKLAKILEGNPIMLIYDGKVIKENLKKANVSMTELDETIREHGIESIQDVDLSIFEIDGSISVLSKDFQKKTRRKKKHYKDIV